MNAKKLGMVVCAVGAIAASALAAPIVPGTTETWGANDAGWTMGGGMDNLAWNGGIGQPAGSLQGTFNAQGIPFPQDGYMMDATAGSAFTGNYTPVLPVTYYQLDFDFMAQDYSPSSLQFYFHNNSSGNSWTYNLTVPANVGQWYHYTVAMQYSGGWTLNFGPGGTSGIFGTDIGQVDEIGIYLVRNTNIGQQDFFLDNFALSAVEQSNVIPEPETVWMLLTALMSVGITFRGRLGDAIRRVTKRA